MKLNLDPYLIPEPHLASKESGWVGKWLERGTGRTEDFWAWGEFRSCFSKGAEGPGGPGRTTHI